MRRSAALTIALALLAGAAHAAVRLGPGPHISASVSAAPRILAGATPAARARINAALAAADKRGGKAAAECREYGGKNATWERSVTTTFAGPDYLSVLIADNYYCGGAHPDFGQTALVFSLADGRLVDWTALAPASLKAEAVLDTAPDGAKLGVLGGAGMKALYGPMRGDCKEVADSITGFMMWPDRKAGGLVLQPVGLPHAVAACADPVTMKPDRLRAAGFVPALVAALSVPAP